MIGQLTRHWAAPDDQREGMERREMKVHLRGLTQPSVFLRFVSYPPGSPGQTSGQAGRLFLNRPVGVEKARALIIVPKKRPTWKQVGMGCGTFSYELSSPVTLATSTGQGCSGSSIGIT